MMNNHNHQNAPSLHIRNLTLRYGENTLFNNLSFTLEASKCSCLLGPSGVGKSTLLRFIAGLTTGCQQNADMQIHASDHLPINNRIAYMAQTDLLMPWLSVLDNVLIGYRLRGELRKDKHHRLRAIELLGAVGLQDSLEKKPEELSGGMRQRAALARTLLENKPIVLMDEPFSALDAITKLHLQELAAELLQNKTVLLITHDPLEALRLGHYVYVMSGQPATLGQPITPQGEPARNLTDSAILTLQGELLLQLEQAQLC